MEWRMSIARKELKAQDFKGITTGRKLASVHPGAVLLADFIEPMGLTRYRVAKAIGVQQRRVDEICAGTRSITADTAVRLGLLFNMEPEFWMRLQVQFDIEVLMREHGAKILSHMANNSSYALAA
jgi:antitoxin HigA-1